MPEKDQLPGIGAEPCSGEGGTKADQTVVSEINRRQISASDKSFRMFAGASTCLVGFEDKCFELETTVDKRDRTVPIEQLVRNIAEAWHRAPELKSYRECRVHLKRSESPTGFAVSAPEGGKEGGGGIDALANAAMAFVKRMQDSRSEPKSLVAVFDFAFDLDENGEVTRSTVQWLGDADPD